MIEAFDKEELEAKGWEVDEQQLPSDYVTHEELTETLEDYALKTEIPDVSQYITNSELTTILESYVPLSSYNALVSRVAALESSLSALQQNALVFDSADNVVLREGTKILATVDDGSTHEILGLNIYNRDTAEQFYACEVGNMHYNTTLNTKDDIAVDTEHGREYVQYVSNGGKAVYRGDLSETNSNVQLTLDDILVSASRVDATTISVLLTSPTSTVSIPITRRVSGASTIDTWRQRFNVATTGTIIDTITIGTYLMAEYWVTYHDAQYYVVAGSDDNDLSTAWIEIYEGFAVDPPTP